MGSKKWIFSICVFSIWQLVSGSSHASTIDKMLDVTVSVVSISAVEIDNVGDSVWDRGSGSGVFVSKSNCEVWTNHHVVQGAAWIEVQFRDYPEPVPARLISSDPVIDIAILEMDRCEKIQRAASLGNSDVLQVGDRVYVAGNPLGGNPDSITGGILSHRSRFREGGSIPYLQTDAALNLGNSGGALFNEHGEVVGITSAFAAINRTTPLGIGYAIPVNVAANAVTRLHDGPPASGELALGRMIDSLSPSEAQLFGAPRGLGGVVILSADTVDNTDFQRYDVITKVGDVFVSSVDELRRVVASYEPGATARVEVIRDRELMVLDAGVRNGISVVREKEPDSYDGYLGMALEMMDPYPGPIIRTVMNLGPAHHARIRSSQNTLLQQGTSTTPIQFDVQSVTGIVYRGKYQPIPTVEALERVSELAFRSHEPLLLEIEHWARTDSRIARPLEHSDTKLYLVKPRKWTSTLSHDKCAVDRTCASIVAERR